MRAPTIYRLHLFVGNRFIRSVFAESINAFPTFLKFKLPDKLKFSTIYTIEVREEKFVKYFDELTAVAHR